MNIKTKIVTALTLAVLIVPGISLAQTMSVAQLQAEIASLTAQLQSLETQLAAAGGSATWCYTFNNNLSIGMSGAAVTALQTSLQKDGESINITGTFDDQTASAVTAFQEKHQSQILAPYGLSYGTGYAGKSTRAELNLLFGCTGVNSPITNSTSSTSSSLVACSTLMPYCPYGGYGVTESDGCSQMVCYTSPIASTTVTISSPSSGQTFTQGSSNTVSWTGTLSSTTLELYDSSGQVFEGTISPEPVSSNTTGIGNSYSWNAETLYGEGPIGGTASTIAPGSYRIKVTDDQGDYAMSGVFAVATAAVASTTIPTVTLSANPATITLGQSSTLTWSSTNATTCTADWAGSEPPSGSLSTAPTSMNVGEVTYQMFCTGAGGRSNTASATITVNPVAPSVPTVTLSANPATITLGQSSTLTWSSTNATTCTADWAGSEPTSGFLSTTPMNVGKSTYEMLCTGLGGTSNTVSATVTVNAQATAMTIPTITKITPNQGTLGTSITISGSNLSGATEIALCNANNQCNGFVNGANAIVSSDGTSLQFSLPAVFFPSPVVGGTTQLHVTTPTGNSNSLPFQVLPTS